MEKNLGSGHSTFKAAAPNLIETMQQTELNSQQQEVVNHHVGPLLVLAGAGTGKTRVLTSRIINIVNSGLASPYEILAVTFTNKAASEMRHRIGAVAGDQVNHLWIGTFHSVAAKILRRHAEIVGLRADFTIIDDDDQTRLIKQILGDFNLDPKQFPAKSYLHKISRLKDQGVSAKKFSGEENDLPKLKEVFELYQSRLKASNATDFGDLLLYNLEIFKTAPDVLANYQNKFRYILVDEYQDTNNTQYHWLLALSSQHQNICCVGDDDQSIYSWRGANIANILRFEKDFADAKVVRLEQNYRSTGNILKAADSVISNNRERHKKTLWTESKAGEKVKVFSFPDDRTEAGSIARAIQTQIRSYKFQANNVAVLVRAGYQTRSFEEAFIQLSVPYKVVGGMKFYERMEIRDAIAYLRICSNLNDDLALNRIINTPKRGCGEAAISSLYTLTKEKNIPFFTAIQDSLEQGTIKGKARDALSIMAGQISRWNKEIQTTKLSELARRILNESGYIDMWKAENSIESRGRLENIEEFINSLNDFQNITEFLEYVSLLEARDDQKTKDSVNIMTIHAAKGLEFDLVFVPGLEDGIFPSAKSMDESNRGVEEERRLMYVAITRARKELVLSHAKSRYIFGDYQIQMPSQFLNELPKADITFEDVAANFSGSSYGSSSYSGNSWGGAKTYSSNSFAKPSFGKTSYQNPTFATRTSSSFGTNKSFSKPSPTSGDPAIGKRIFHQKFGYGKVIATDGNKLEIAFEKTGSKTVMKDFVTLA
jgi:DNA helicase-2/ATP-dependent DNA helicase PcrA